MAWPLPSAGSSATSGPNFGDERAMSASERALSIFPAGAQDTLIQPAPADWYMASTDPTIDMVYRVAFNRTRGLVGDGK